MSIVELNLVQSIVELNSVQSIVELNSVQSIVEFSIVELNYLKCFVMYFVYSIVVFSVEL